MSFGPAVLLAAIGAIVLAAIAGALRPRAAPWAAALATALLATALALALAFDPPRIDVPWIASLGSRLSLELDALGAALALLTAGLATPILAYSSAYLPARLAERAKGEESLRAGSARAPRSREPARFAALMLAFALSMVLLALARDLLVLFAALELTAIASFLLIGFERDDPSARRAAMLALVVTMGSSLAFLAGALLVSMATGTTQLDALLRSERRGAVGTAALACLVFGSIAKSAQVPLHFWLPRAMVAPTPVSAYLHSAALVAAGVFVLMRLRPLLALEPAVLDALAWIGAASVAVGAVLALVADDLKRILACSTIAQLGHAMALLGLGGDEGAAGVPFFLLAHGLPKSALFLVAGAITHATGATRLSELGGLARRLPSLAVSSAIAAAALAGLPLTIGYFEDELLLAAAARRGGLPLALAVLAGAATLAYVLRFWAGLFLGPARGTPRREVPAAMSAPIALLAALVLLGGAVPGPLERAFERAGRFVAGASVDVHFTYRLADETVAALVAWALGLFLYASRRAWAPRLASMAAAASRALGPAALADRIARAGRAASDALHRLDVRDVRARIGFVLLPTAGLVLLAVIFGAELPAAVAPPDREHLPVAIALAVTAVAATLVAQQRRHASVVLLLSFVGYGLAGVLALSGAPDVALVVVLVETTFALLFLAVLAHVPRAALGRSLARHRRPRYAATVAIAMGATVFLVVLSALGRRVEPDAVRAYLSLSELAHGADVVTVILADFRGLDTAVELTVLVMALTGARAIARGRA